MFYLTKTNVSGCDVFKLLSLTSIDLFSCDILYWAINGVHNLNKKKLDLYGSWPLPWLGVISFTIKVLVAEKSSPLQACWKDTPYIYVHPVDIFNI